MAITLDTLFDSFCQYLDGKLRWSETKDSEWTQTVWRFFSEKNQTESIPCSEIRDYMLVDYIWRYDPKNFSFNDIVLAVEHDNQESDVMTLATKEVQHLVDLKAKNKVGIFYPRPGDEKDLIEEIKHRIKAQWSDTILPFEKYLIILGYATTKAGKRAILFRGFIFNKVGDLEKQMEHVILQAT